MGATPAKAVSVRSRLYYCTCHNGSGWAYEVAEVIVVGKSTYGRWYAEGYVYFTRRGVKYSASDLGLSRLDLPVCGVG